MKTNLIILIIVISISSLLIGCNQTTESVEDITIKTTTVTETQMEATTTAQIAIATTAVSEDLSILLFGAAGSREDESFTIEEMMQYAIEDEYLARQEYELILTEFGDIRPFANIIKAEETHIILMETLYATYNYSIPEDIAIDYTLIPSSLVEALEVGIEAEINNIAMYDMFLLEDLPDDIRETFIILRDGSISHLKAFETSLSRK